VTFIIKKKKNPNGKKIKAAEEREGDPEMNTLLTVY
jgi:hypothetical protein